MCLRNLVVTERRDVVVLDEEGTAAERDLVHDDGEAVDVTRLSARYVRVAEPLLFTQQLGRRPQQRYTSQNTNRKSPNCSLEFAVAGR